MFGIKHCIKIVILLLIFFGIFLYRQFNITSTHSDAALQFTVAPGETVSMLATKLEEEQLIRSASWFVRYIQLKGIDTKIQAGTFVVEPPVTFAKIAEALVQQTKKGEKEITIIPGWDNRDVAAYLASQGVGSEEDIFRLIGESARDYRVNPFTLFSSFSYPLLAELPKGATLEGYLAPDTYRIFDDASVAEVIAKLLAERDAQFTADMYRDIRAGGRSVHDVIIVASLLEREVRTTKDKAIVADIFWRRLDAGWPLQADSTIHYLTNKKGDVFTTSADRAIESPWNTYTSPGLPLGPIAHPSVESIQAAIYPEKNDYWYFLTTLDTGEVIYAKTNDEHNRNVRTHLR